MPKFSQSSQDKLSLAHPLLQKLFNEVIKTFDCTIVCSHRDREDQDKAFLSGNSKVKFPNSKHNSEPSFAVDVMPYPIDWLSSSKNIEKLTLFAGFVLGTAKQLGIEIRWGHDWDRDYQPDERGLVDRPHYELVLK